MMALIVPMMTIVLILIACGKLSIRRPIRTYVLDEYNLEAPLPKYDEIEGYDLVEHPPSYESLNVKHLPGMGKNVKF